MESMGKKPRRRRSFTPEFKAEIVELCQRGDRSVGQVARDFDLTETAVREWVKQAERDAGTRAGRRSDQRRAQGAGRAAAGEPAAAGGRGDPQAGDGFLREGDPVNVLPVHRGGESAAAQRQAGVRAAEGLPCRLLRRPRRAALGPGPPGRRADRADQGRAQAVQGPVRRAADPRRAAPPGPPALPQADRPADAPGRAGRAGAAGGGRRPPSRTRRPRPGPTRSAGTSPPTPPGSTSAGAATSPTSPPGRAGSTWPPSSTSPPAASSGSPWPITCAPSWSRTRWPTRSPPATRRRA